MLKVKLNRDLRKSILRGHPWVYSQALEKPSKMLDSACLCQVLDKSSKFLAFAIYDPHSPLALRILSLDKKPPGSSYFSEAMDRAWQMRKVGLSKNTTAFRLFNGEGDLLPGLVCDVYDQLAVLQFDGLGPFEFWDQDFIADWLLKNEIVKGVFYKPRKSDDMESRSWGEVPKSDEVLISENSVSFWVNFREGQKTGFFLDQRENRHYLSSFVADKTVLNLFSYSGGFSLYAGLGGAKKVLSVDLAQPALDLAEKSWNENNFEGSHHESLCVDIFKYLDQDSQKWDVVVVDPPSLTHSEKNKKQAVHNYVDIFSRAARKVNRGGHLVLSSCSSHISFNDFFEIVNESLSGARRKGKIHRVSGQGFDHPYPHYCPELRYLKFVHIALD